MTRERLNELIKKANEIHGNKYDYSFVLVNPPQTVKDKITLKCPKHDLKWETTFDTHINSKSGCPKCAGNRKKTTEEFISECKEILKDKDYDYSLVEYKNVKTPVKVICHKKDVHGVEHGLFEVQPSMLLKRCGCPKCAHKYMDTDMWIDKAKKVHGNRYDYSKSVYVDSRTPITIICPIHGEFKQAPSSHVGGKCGCPKCNGGVSFDRDTFIKIATEKHEGKYSYDKFVYVNARTKGIITCPIHGDFEQTPELHANRGNGCPKCASSVLENILIKEFEKRKIQFSYQKRFDDLKGHIFDFYLENKNMAIECQGEQHFYATRIYVNMVSPKDRFESQLKKDKEKYEYCKENGIRLIYYSRPNAYICKISKEAEEFYKDKEMYQEVDDIINAINGIKPKEKETKKDSFYFDITSLNEKIKMVDNKFVYYDFNIFLCPINVEDRLSISDKIIHSNKKWKCIIVFDDEYNFRRKIVLSNIRKLLGFTDDFKRIDKNECEIREIDKEEAREFLNDNDLEGFLDTKIHIGAYHDGELIAIVSCDKRRSNRWIFKRTCLKIETLCDGLFKDMFDWFIEKYNPIRILSKSDRRWNPTVEDSYYHEMGMAFVLREMADYKYVANNGGKIRINKSEFTPEIMNKRFGLPIELVEDEMTKKLGYHKVYDGGAFMFGWDNDEYYKQHPNMKHNGFGDRFFKIDF